MSLTLARPPLFTIRFLDTRLVQADEIWSFVYAKAKNVPEDKRDTFGYGDVWTWTALDAESKLMISWLLGEWTAEAARDFMADVASRLVLRPQIVTDANFGRPHQSPGKLTTPAMAAGISDHVWTCEEIAALLD